LARKAFKFRLYPNKETEKQLYFTLNRCRELYNACLSERKDSYQLHARTQLQINPETGQVIAATMIANQKVAAVSYFGQKRDLVALKDLREEYQSIASHVLQDVILRVQRAFQRFFDGAGFPRFKGRDRYDSFTYPDGAGWKLTVKEQGKQLKGTLHLSKIGDVKVKLHRKIEGTSKTITIKREVDQWVVVFSCEVPEPEKLPVSYEDVGIDVGVTHLATLSNGEMIEHPRYYRRARKTLEKRQQALSRKKKGSHRRERAKKLIGRAHKKITKQRRDFLHKESRKLVNRYQVLVFEDLQVANMVRKPKPKQDEETGQYLPNGASAKGGLNKSILDAGWGMFVTMCAAKAAEAGRTLVKVDPHQTSQACSGCGRIVKKDLDVRVHVCPHCGLVLDRDVNAAITILARGRQQRTLGAGSVPRKPRRVRSARGTA
jgi:putative transposase